MKKLLLILIVFIFYGCHKEHLEVKKTPLVISDIKLLDAGKVTGEPPFEFSPDEDINIQNCLIKTLHIRPNDSIKSAEAYLINKQLYINIYTHSPYDLFSEEDKNKIDREKFPETRYHIQFKLHGITKGEYKTDIRVNGYQNTIGYTYTFK